MFEALSKISEDPEAKKKILVFGVTIGLALAAIGLGIALYLGTIGYDVRRTLLHEARLQGVLQEEPTLYQIVVGLEEKAPLVGSPESEEELEGWIAQYGDQKKEEILEKGREWPITRIFNAGDMIYFIYFDEEQIMKDFTYISTPDYRPDDY